jgi:hypothetical protein
MFWNSSRLIHDYIHVEALKTREISINENFLQEPGIGPKLVLSKTCPEHGRMGRMDPKLVLLALRSFCEGGSAVEGVVEREGSALTTTRI